VICGAGVLFQTRIMGDKDKDTSVEKLCEAMQRMLVQLMEQSQSKSSSASENLKIMLEPNPVRLSGPGDYFSWARNASLILGAHGLQKYLKEDEKKPANGIEKEEWEQNWQHVMVWLLSSMEQLFENKWRICKLHL
jgi:hypothetical protein